MSTFEVGNVVARPLGNPELAALKRMAWRMVALATIATMCCSTPVVMMSMGVFIHPLASGFRSGPGAISLSFSAGAGVFGDWRSFHCALACRLLSSDYAHLPTKAPVNRARSEPPGHQG